MFGDRGTISERRSTLTTETNIPPDSNHSIPEVPEISRPLVRYVPDELQDNNWLAWGYE
jgi:hypothetical protein